MNQGELYELQAGQPAGDGMDNRQAALLRLVLRHIAGCSSPQVAELSIGNGALSLGLLSARADLRITCVDISPSLIAHLRSALERLPGGLSSRARLLELDLDADLSRLPAQAFDAVVAVDVMEHLFDVFAFVAHCHRVLKPGGVLLLRVPNIGYVKHRLALLRGRLPVTSSWFGPEGSLTAWRSRYGWDGGHLHYFNSWALRELVQQEGFEVLSMLDAGASLEWLRKLWPALLAGNLTLLGRKPAPQP